MSLATVADVEAAILPVLGATAMWFTEILQNEIDANGKQVLRYLATQGEGAVVNQAILAQQCSSEQWQITLSN